MGLTVGLIGCLLREAAGAPFFGNLATLGKQKIVGSRDQIVAAFESSKLISTTSLGGIELGNTAVNDSELLSALGFSIIESIDASSYEGATIVFDLNTPITPDHLQNRYDCILDSGTIEHVFDVPAALRHVHRMLKVGGRAIFFSPANNTLEHGFYQFCPTLFYDYFKANNYQINHMYLLRRAHDLYCDFEAFAYKPEDHNFWELSAIDDYIYLIWASATKTEHSTCDAVPIQHRYAQEQWLLEESTSDGGFQRLLSRTRHPALKFVLWKLRGALKLAIALWVMRRFRSHNAKQYDFKLWGGA